MNFSSHGFEGCDETTEKNWFLVIHPVVCVAEKGAVFGELSLTQQSVSDGDSLVIYTWC